MDDSPKDPKIAGLPPYLDEQHESVCKISLCIEFDRILCGLRWWRRRVGRPSSHFAAARTAAARTAAAASATTTGSKRFTRWYLGGHRF